MVPAKYIEPWEVLEIGSRDMGIMFSLGVEYFFLMVDKATSLPVAYPTKTKEAEAVASYLLDLSLTFGTPMYIRSDRRGEFRAKVVNNVCRWLKVEISYGPADHPGGQRAV